MTKYILPSLFVLLGTVVCINAVIATISSNLSTGIVLTYLIGAALLAWGIAYRFLPTWLTVAVGGALLIVAVCITALFLYGKTDSVTYKEDTVIVLGASIKGDKPTKSLQNRLDRAVSYHAHNPEATIVVSGGKGSGKSVTEAEAMAQYLIAQGVPASRIVKEDAATSTQENFRFSRPLIDENDSVCFITTDYHIFRASRYATRAGFQTVTHAHSTTPWYMIVPSGLRECLAVGKLWIFG